MTNSIAKIRAFVDLMRNHAISVAYGRQLYAADSALAELEKAAAEPLFILTTGAIGSDGEQDDWDIECDSSRRLESFCAAHPGDTVKLYAYPPAPVSEIREARMFTADEMENAYKEGAYDVRYGSGIQNREWQNSVTRSLIQERAELGPTLGMVELKEPTPEECERICTEYERLLMRECTCGGRECTCGGRDAFDAVRNVMWPKEEL